MRIAYVDIKNFRGIASGRIYFNGHTVLIGDNNSGKSSIFEAIDLVLGPDRCSRIPVIDEHDFHNGIYIDGETPVSIEIEVLVIDLIDEQKRRFKNNFEYWHQERKLLIPAEGIEEIKDSAVVEALRVKFNGAYDSEDDDFIGQTYFCWPETDAGFTKFTKTDKRECGFLYLRALRTGARALSLERGSLLDIILRIRKLKPKMWENVLSQLKETKVAEGEGLGVNEILTSVQESLQEFVPADWGADPHLKVSDLTREHLRKTLTVFMSTGVGGTYAPFQHQGTGTINTMVLALLSMIAEAKKTVIFAMEEPEIAIPPYTQKRIVDCICRKSTQGIFSSHSPFVLEEFSSNNIILIQRNGMGEMEAKTVKLPSVIKPKAYGNEFRLRFAESLLAKRILLTEGATEASSYSVAARELCEQNAVHYSSMEKLGIAVFDAGSESNIPVFGGYFKELGKIVFAVFDKQTPEQIEKIKGSVDFAFESTYKGFESLILEETDPLILKEFVKELIENKEWPGHLRAHAPDIENPEEVKAALMEYLKWSKGAKSCAAILSICKEEQMPITIRSIIREMKNKLQPITAENESV